LHVREDEDSVGRVIELDSSTKDKCWQVNDDDGVWAEKKGMRTIVEYGRASGGPEDIW
jgi:hypothetical protein